MNDKLLIKTTQEQILSMMKPNPLLVFVKLIVVQAFIGTLTLLFCPQFNLSLTSNAEIFHYIHMNYGMSVCMIACGAIFIGSGALFSSTIMKSNELNLIMRNKILFYLLISGIAPLIFMIFGADIYLNLLFFWMIGALVFGTTFFIISKEAKAFFIRTIS